MINRAAVLGALLVAVSSVVAYSPAFAKPVQYCGTAEVGEVLIDPPAPTAPCMLTSYYDVATSVMPSAAGYGGLGQSGGAGDALVRIVNPNHNDTLQDGTLCAYIYVFDDNEEMQECCGCPVTPDGMRTLSTINDLTSNFGFNGGDGAAGVIDIFSGQLDWVAPFPGAPPPLGVNVAGSSGLGCDPSFGGGIFISGGPADPIVPTDDGAIESTILDSELRAWTDHAESMVGVSAPFKGVVSTSTDEFASVPADSTHFLDLVESCAFLLNNGSGSGVCSCGRGDNQSTFRPHS
ncbi:MAG: hypothetical protein WA005_01155 [Candidatus Binataceae bacterium]